MLLAIRIVCYRILRESARSLLPRTGVLTEHHTHQNGIPSVNAHAQAVSVGVIYCILYTHYLIACLVQSQEMLTDVFNILFLASGVVKSRF